MELINEVFSLHYGSDEDNVFVDGYVWNSLIHPLCDECRYNQGTLMFFTQKKRPSYWDYPTFKVLNFSLT